LPHGSLILSVLLKAASAKMVVLVIPSKGLVRWFHTSCFLTEGLGKLALVTVGQLDDPYGGGFVSMGFCWDWGFAASLWFACITLYLKLSVLLTSVLGAADVLKSVYNANRFHHVTYEFLLSYSLGYSLLLAWDT